MLLAQVKLEDVFKSTHESMNGGAGSSGQLLAILLGTAALLLLMLLLNYHRRNQATPRPVNHRGKLLKELLKVAPLKSAEVKQLKRLAERQSCSSPLVLLLCPSVLEKAIKSQPPAQRPTLTRVLERVGRAGAESSDS